MSVLVIPELESEDELLLEPDETPVVPVSDDRANIPVSETAERFLRAVLAKVPLDRIEELHLFSPLRQGTAETGIAVIAARVIVLDEPKPSNFELQLMTGPQPGIEEPDVDEPGVDEPGVDAPGVDEPGVDVPRINEPEVDDPDVDEPAVEEPDVGENDSGVPAVEEPEVGEAHADVNVIATSTVANHVDGADTRTVYEEDESPYADEPAPVAADLTENSSAEPVPHVADEVPDERRAPRVRHTVYTARYRLVVKGPDRGKWEMDVVDEADAPLLAVETVVRGVQRRAGEETATVRYDAVQLARALRITT
ncbi:MAG: hypothetical protein H7Z40_14025 [Phycisphaerae bacterium]|nr:hypothetical protein [Gemmatimonadaceae bacterium]